jgi:c-di-GMP-binding flagellar brake protein YcgR
MRLHNTLQRRDSGDFRSLDRRRFKRVPVLRPAKYRDGKFGETKSLILDLSEGGAYIESPVVPEGSQIELEFNLVDGYKVRAVGVVRYLLLGTGMGVEFQQISDQDRRRIAEFVDGFRASQDTPSGSCLE